jgi:nicotinamide phosphoribosyltransferase
MDRFKKMNRNPILWTDGYKLSHREQYPEGVNWVYETWTPRLSRIDGINHVCFFGLQGAMGEITQMFDEHFFKKKEEDVVRDYVNTQFRVFRYTNADFASSDNSAHIRKLHQLGYLPVKIKALPEGTFVRIGVPMFTVENTLPEFFWLPGYLESMLSSMIWQPMTAATIADQYRRILENYAELTGDMSKIPFQGCDFSMRGMGSPEAAYRVSSAHLTSFEATATISAREYLKAFYHANEDVMRYTPATEHSVMCSYGKDETEAFRHLITEVYPSGNISIVSDSYDLWNVIDTVLPALKDEIMNRNGKVVIRPDSGDPVAIICGDKHKPVESSEYKGVVERLYEVFGGYENEKGYKELDSHIGVIYGDSITPARAESICIGLYNKGFASTNVVMGIGSYSYQYTTRDTFGFALKCTAIKINDTFKPIFKDPKTDNDHFKKSQKGMVAVVWDTNRNDWNVMDNLTPEEIKEMDNAGKNYLKDFFIDGNFDDMCYFDNNFNDIRHRIKKESGRIYNK